MDPITIIVTALALGAAAGLKPVVEQAIKDGYDALKALIQHKYANVNLAMLEDDPKSEARRDVVKEDLTKAQAGQDRELLTKAKELLDAVHSQAPGTAEVIGVDLKDIKAASLRIQDIVSQGPGVKVDGAELTGDIEIGQVRAGSREPEAPNAERQ
jgi:hypothetical protein